MLRQRLPMGGCPGCEVGTIYKYEDEDVGECLECGHKVTYGSMNIVTQPPSDGVIQTDMSNPTNVTVINNSSSKIDEQIEVMTEVVEGKDKLIEDLEKKLEEAKHNENAYEILLQKQTEKTAFVKRSLANYKIGTSIAFLLVMFVLLIGSIMFRQIEDIQEDVRYIQYIVEPHVIEIVEVIPSEELVSEEATEVLNITERELITRVVAAEARGEGVEGMMAVAQVIKDRSELWSMTPTAVVTSPGQFAPPYSGRLTSDVHHAVSQVFDEDRRVFEEPVTHFYSGSSPYWSEYKTEVGKVNNHTFLH